jgi:hypothetical protein
MYSMRVYRTAWFEKYEYMLSAAFTGAVALSGLIVFFAVQYKPKPISWWGNDVVSSGIDGGAGQTALLQDPPAKGYFGLDRWS